MNNQQNDDWVNDCSFELSNHSSQFFRSTGIQQNRGPSNFPNTIMGRFGSPSSAFYATEHFMGFPLIDPLVQPYYTDSLDNNEPNFQTINTLQNSHSYGKSYIPQPPIPLAADRDFRVSFFFPIWIFFFYSTFIKLHYKLIMIVLEIYLTLG